MLLTLLLLLSGCTGGQEIESGLVRHRHGGGRRAGGQPDRHRQSAFRHAGERRIGRVGRRERIRFGGRSSGTRPNRATSSSAPPRRAACARWGCWARPRRARSTSPSFGKSSSARRSPKRTPRSPSSRRSARFTAPTARPSSSSRRIRRAISSAGSAPCSACACPNTSRCSLNTTNSSTSSRPARASPPSSPRWNPARPTRQPSMPPGNDFQNTLLLQSKSDLDRLPGHLPRTAPAPNEYMGAALFSGPRMTGTLTGNEVSLLLPDGRQGQQACLRHRRRAV